MTTHEEARAPSPVTRAPGNTPSPEMETRECVWCGMHYSAPASSNPVRWTAQLPVGWCHACATVFRFFARGRR